MTRRHRGHEPLTLLNLAERRVVASELTVERGQRLPGRAFERDEDAEERDEHDQRWG
jgi:hypothetical protein